MNAYVSSTLLEHIKQLIELEHACDLENGCIIVAERKASHLACFFLF